MQARTIADDLLPAGYVDNEADALWFAFLILAAPEPHEIAFHQTVEPPIS